MIPGACSLPLTHLLIVGIVIRGLVVLDKEGLRHAVRCRRVEPDVTLVLERLCLLQKSESVHWSHAALRRTLPLLIGGVEGFGD